MKKLLTLIAILFVNSQLSFVHCQDKPRLVVGIIIDQMRWDYLERYKDRYSEGGFKRMMNQGYNCTQCMINYIPAVTAVGHTSTYTGSVPALHGIVNNSFMLDGKSTSAPYDASMQTVGSTSDAGKRSPHLMMATTIGDELRMSTNFRSKVIGIAIKDRAAILPAGHSANAAYWLDNSPNDEFITSTYYMKELPKWVVKFNKRDLAKKYMKRDWPKKMMYSQKTYVQSHPLDERIEIKVGTEIRTTPWGATLTFDMAQAAVEGEKLGQDEFTDMLCVSVSSTDAIAHRVGSNSSLVEDTYLWLDRDLERFFKFLDEYVGKGQWTAFLTADHAGSHNPQWRMDHKLPAEIWETTEWVDKLNQMIANKTGVTGKVVTGISSFKVMLDEALMREKGLNRNEVADLVVNYLRSQSFVHFAFDVERMPDYIPEPIRTMTQNGYYPGRTGQIQIVPKGGVMEAFRYGAENLKGANHMLWGPDDTHIPLLFLGRGVPQAKNNHTVHITDIAATICSLLHIQQPSACVGEPIF